MSRPTIIEVAQRAGVSKSAVSYALNNKPGVSSETRDRILAIAHELGWKPSVAARALAGTRVGSIGLVLNRPATLLGLEPFYMEFISGMHAVLGPRDISLVLKVVGSQDDECATYASWSSSRKVDGVLLVDLSEPDPRPSLLRELGIPAVAVGPKPDQESVAIWTDDAGAMRQVVYYLAALGHREIARVGGTARYLHSRTRTGAMREAMTELGLGEPTLIIADFSKEQGASATRQLLSGPTPPTAIVYDNDVMAAAGLGVAHEMGIEVPDGVSMVAWDDSMVSQLTHPPLTSVSTDVHGYGAVTATALLDLIDGKPVTSVAMSESRLAVRASTASRKS